MESTIVIMKNMGGGLAGESLFLETKENSFAGYLEEDLEITVLCHKHQWGMAVYRHGYVYTPVAYVWCLCQKLEDIFPF